MIILLDIRVTKITEKENLNNRLTKIVTNIN